MAKGAMVRAKVSLRFKDKAGNDAEVTRNLEGTQRGAGGKVSHIQLFLYFFTMCFIGFDMTNHNTKGKAINKPEKEKKERKKKKPSSIH